MQFASLATQADTTSLSELAQLSPRQLQRILRCYNARYNNNGGDNWRDLRNRWRLQVAAVLLSVEGPTVGEIASEVGYGSAPALARAFAKAGFPTPTDLRRRLLLARRDRPGSLSPSASPTARKT